MGLSSTLILKLLLVVAGSPDIASQATTPDPEPISGGVQVNSCGWPSVVYVSGNGYLCTGSLIHPEIVATAAHCIEVMEPATTVRFGNTANSSQEYVGVDFCMGSPDFVSNGDGTIAFDQVQHDWGFCKLSAPVTEVVPIPVAYGCEMDQVVEGTDLIRVGFGKETMATNQFFKRWVETPINSIPFTDPATGWPTQLSEGGGGVGTCPGDSGGPSFISVATEGGGEAWRMVSIQSTQPVEDAEGNEIECGTQPNNTAVLAQGVPFIEQMSGIDITPCHDEDGNWDPSFDCQGFVTDPFTGGGSWAMGCQMGPLTGFADSCGGAFDELTPDTGPPSVFIVEPADDLVLPYEGEAVAVHVLAQADDADGWGMAHVELLIIDADTDEVLATFDDLVEAYEWDPEFPQGSFLIQAIGYDNAGLVTETDTRAIYVGVDPPGAGDDGDDADGGSDDAADEDSGDAGGDAAEGTGGGDADAGDAGDAETGDGGDGTGIGDSGGQRGDGDDGCACSTSTDRRGTLPLLLLLVAPLLRRRRR